MDIPGEHSPLLVHITGSDLAGDIAKQRPRRIGVTAHTYVCTASQPIQQICGREPNRKRVIILPIDNSVILCDSDSQSRDAANTTTGLATPNGAYLPVSLAAPYPVETTDQLWVVAAAYPTRVSVTIESYAEA